MHSQRIELASKYSRHYRAWSEETFVMRSERQKMLTGELYDPLDPELVRAREHAPHNVLAHCSK